jgi:para-aminobenzoate synthetase
MSSPSFLLTYNLAHRRVTLHRASHLPVQLHLKDETFWNWFGEGQQALSSALTARDKREGHTSAGERSGSCKGSTGFRGGWVGWFAYEMKQESLAGYARPPDEHLEGHGHDINGSVDAAMSWCDRILERDTDGEWIARSIVRDETILPPSDTPEFDSNEEGDHSEVRSMIPWLQAHGITFGITSSDSELWSSKLETPLADPPAPAVVASNSFPDFAPVSDGEAYQDQIAICREAIRQGESYELTLTTKFTASAYSPVSSEGSLPAKPLDPLSLYLRLRTANPAYYSTYLSFPDLLTTSGKGLTIVSSSPERFLKIERGVVEMGREVDCEGGERCRQIASAEDARRGEELRLDPKERAENLMVRASDGTISQPSCGIVRSPRLCIG